MKKDFTLSCINFGHLDIKLSNVTRSNGIYCATFSNEEGMFACLEEKNSMFFFLISSTNEKYLTTLDTVILTSSCHQNNNNNRLKYGRSKKSDCVYNNN